MFWYYRFFFKRIPRHVVFSIVSVFLNILPLDYFRIAHTHTQTGTITGALPFPLSILHIIFRSIGNNLVSISNILDIK